MAVDEALLASATAPSLRVYRWQKPALSFGYFGLFSIAAAQGRNREIVRRWTGGGVVLHGDDLTYSIIIPPRHCFLSHTSLEIYSAVHEAIRRALNKNGIDVTLATSVPPNVSDDCFSNPVRADLICAGKKIGGAAHRRSRLGLLHQGSIQIIQLPQQFIEDFAGTLCDRFERKLISEELITRATAIAAERYETTAWLMRR